MNTENKPIVMSEEFWANSQLSVVRYYGQIKMYGCEYVICNKDGKNIFECSLEAEKEGRELAIEPGEPCDLVRTDVVPIYRKLGREKFLEFLDQNTDVWTLKEIKKRLKRWQSKSHSLNVPIANIANGRICGLLHVSSSNCRLRRTGRLVFQLSK